MTTAEKYRQLEKSPAINIARYIFNCIKDTATNSILGNEIVEIKTGKTPSKQEKRFYEDEYLNWFKPNEIGSNKFLYTAKDKLSKFAFESNQATIYEPDTILINAIGDVGRISILKTKASSNQQITGIRLNEKIIIDYAYYYLLSHREFFYVDLFQTTLPIVNQKKINTIPFVYPEFDEQKRIVAGLIQIDLIKSIRDLRIIDNLDWNENYKKISRKFFNLQFNSINITNEFNHQLSLVKELRKQLLQDAIQGKLAEQNLDDEPARELIKRIKSEKELLIKEKKLKKEKELLPIKKEDIPFEIPENWIWCKLGEVTTRITDGEHLTPPRISEGRKLLSAKNIRDGFIEFDNVDHISEETFQKAINRCNPQKSDILIVSVGGTIGRSSILESDEEFAIVRSVALIKPAKSISNRYIKLLLDSPLLQKDINTRAWGTAQPCLYINQIKELATPLPPLLEQHRIVQKLDQLMQTCNALEESIKQSALQNEKLLQQVLREALQPKNYVVA